MPLLQRSSAAPSDIELYMEGSCHVFALALHRRYGMRLLVVVDTEDDHWRDPADADNFIPAVVHVYGLDENDVAWDVRGARPRTAVNDELLSRHGDLNAPDQDECANIEAMTMYIDGMGEDVDRPLHRVEDKDVDEAEACIERVLADLPLPVFPRP